MHNAITYLLAIVSAELITVFIDPIAGIAVYFIILVATLIQPALHDRINSNRLVLSLSLVPLIRIMSLSMPLVDIPQIWWYPIIYLPLAIATVIVIRTFNFNIRSIGLNWGRLPFQLGIGLTGVGFGFVEYLILKPEPIISELTLAAVLLPAFILLATTGFVEELMFRGVLQRTATAVLGNLGIVYVSLIFAVLHIGFLSIIDLFFVFAVALFYGYIVRKTGSLLGVTLSHGMANIALFLVLPFLLG